MKQPEISHLFQPNGTFIFLISLFKPKGTH